MQQHARTQGDDVPLPPAIWRRLLVVMERLAGSSDLDDVLGVIIDSMRDTLGADRASVFQYDPRSHELFASKAHGVDRSLRFSADLGIAGDAVRSRSIVNVHDCYTDPRFNRDIDRATGYTTRAMLTIPLMSFDGGLEGVAQVLNKAAVGEGCGSGFTALDETIARALASQAAVAIRRARLIDAERRKNKIEADLRVAREMQLASLPPATPRIDGYDVAAVNRQAEETGGDTYDLSLLDTPRGPNLLLLLADATGHGIGPALSATQAQAMLRMAFRLATPLDQAAMAINALMHESLPVGRFVTAFLGVLDPREHRVTYLAAGQAPILILRAGGSNEVLNANALPLGVDPVLTIDKVGQIILDPGDTLAVLSDGYFEHTSPTREQFGQGRTISTMRGVTAAPDHPLGLAGAMLDALALDLDRFGAGRPAADDQTALIIRRR